MFRELSCNLIVKYNAKTYNKDTFREDKIIM